ncbi:MAG: hypothetical protein IKV36_00580 [Clostridia bacterium]|nr:hypothetical protein [Clostridia bacterium]
MGKGNRNKELKAAERQAEKERIAKKKARNKKIAKLTTLASAACVGVVAVVLVVVLIINAIANSGAPLRGATVLKSEGATVDGAMASYYMHTLISNFKTNNSTYIDSMMDVGKSLKKQACYYDKNQTWFEYFKSLTLNQIVSYVALADLAAKDGMTLSEANKTQVENSLAALDKYAENSKMSVSAYIKKNYGKGVKKSDIKNALELYYLASQKYQEIYDSKEVSDQDINEYVENNKSSYYKATYYEFTIQADYDLSISDQETINSAVSLAKLRAEALANCKTESEFKALVKEYAIKYLEEDETKADKTVESAKQSDIAYKDSTEMQKWVFSEDRKVGETKIFPGTEKFTVIFIVEPSHKDETPSKNFGHILLTLDKYDNTASMKAKADEILSYLGNSFDDEAFEKAAKEHSEDTIVFYDDVVKGNLDTKLDNWIYDSTRKLGDATVIENGSMVHILYYKGDGHESWQQSAKESIKSAYCTSMTKDAETELNKKSDIDAMDKIDA